jgi:hypothetical protein
MTLTNSHLQEIHVSDPSELEELLGDDHVDFVARLGQPTWITLTGQDTTKSRAIVTLLHANEPSGLKAIHQFLKNRMKPRTNLGIFIASVDAALYPPAFSHRYLPAEKDMNRCFGQSGGSSQEQLANQIVDLLRKFEPEAVVDTHNTSAHSEPFAVAVSDDVRTRQIVQLFTKKLVVLKQSLGTLIEQNLGCPVVTVEFGGFLDPNADELAASSLNRFISQRHIFDMEPETLQTLEKPLRLEVSSTAQLHYSTTVDSTGDITIYNTIDQLNFRRLKAFTTIGWISSEGFDQLSVSNTKQQNIAKDLFVEDAGFLKTKVPMTIFMATTDDHIARNDCLMYLCPEEATE